MQPCSQSTCTLAHRPRTSQVSQLTIYQQFIKPPSQQVTFSVNQSTSQSTNSESPKPVIPELLFGVVPVAQKFGHDAVCPLVRVKVIHAVFCQGALVATHHQPVVIMSSLCRHNVVSGSSLCRHNVVIVSSLRRHNVITGSSLRRHNVVTGS